MKSLIRDLGYISWMDALATYEDTASSEYKLARDEQTSIYMNAIRALDTNLRKGWRAAFDKLPKSYPYYYSFRWAGHTVHVCQQSRYIPTISISVIDGHKHNFGGAIAFGTSKTQFWVIQDLSDEKEDLTLTIYSNILRKLKTIQRVGDTAATVDNKIYYANAEDTFWFNKIYLLEASLDTPKLVYSEHEEKYVLSLLKPKGQEDVFVLRRSALNQDLGYIDVDRVKWLVKGVGRKLPITRTEIAFNNYFMKDRNKISYPDGMFLVDVYKRNDTYVFILCKDATQALYLYKSARWIPLLSARPCDIKFSAHSEDIIIGYPNSPDRVIHLNKMFVPTIAKELQGPKYKLEFGDSPIPWFITLPIRKPKGVVICGYGAYGMSMRKHQQRLWLPWLERGFAIANICVRGGGENGDYWWDAARGPRKRKYAIRDFTIGVSIIQKQYGFNHKNTVIYGRSAGGFLVTAAMYELLDKVAVVYAAKPYTDVLRTVTNPDAKQSLQETDEFGLITDDPHDVIDFTEIAKISPYENVPSAPPQHPAVIVTGGTHDAEVPVYMPLRFAKRLQENGWKNVLCRIQQGEGHFTPRDKEYGEAYDAALCESFINELLELGQFT